MKAKRIQYLIQQYNTEKLSPTEEQELESAIEQGFIEISELDDLHALDQQLDLLLHDLPSQNMQAEFYQMLEQAKMEIKPAQQHRGIRNLWVQLAIAASLLLMGLAAGGLFAERQESDESIAQLSAELRDMREMVMLSLLEKESSSERLRAVNLTDEMDQTSEQVINALLKTLNEDESTNVRMAALNALYVHADKPTVREGLIQAIQHQNSPLIQVALAEFMVSVQEKRSVKEFQEILKSKPLPPPVKKQLEKEIQVLL